MVKERKSEKKERRFLRGEQNYSVKEKSDFTVLVDFISFIFKSKPHRETLCTFYNSFFFCHIMDSSVFSVSNAEIDKESASMGFSC